MKPRRIFRRAVLTAAAVLLLTQLVLAGSAKWLLTVHDGVLRVRDLRSEQWIYTSTIGIDNFSARDQLLLECGILLQNRADFTRAMEDFFS